MASRSTRDDIVFAAFQGPVLSLSSTVLHRHRSFTAELLVPVTWRLARGLTPADVLRALLGARTCRSGSLDPVACPKCGPVVEICHPHPEREGIPEGLESYGAQVRSRCTSSWNHLKCRSLVLAAELVPGLVVLSEPFSVHHRDSAASSSSRALQTQSPPGAAVQGLPGAGTLARMCVSRMEAQVIARSPEMGLEEIFAAMSLCVCVSLVKMPREESARLQDALVELFKQTVGENFLLSKGSYSPGGIVVNVLGFSTTENARVALLMGERFAKNVISNTMGRNLITEGLILPLAFASNHPINF
eukprot:m51a1_g1143 hypothetical protein (303) ;mRNA; r:260194-261246